MAPEQAREIVARFGMEASRLLITQVSRFDPWKDPLAVIDACRIVKAQVPQVQLPPVGSMASDDPEGWHYLDKGIRHAGDDFDVHVLHDFHGLGTGDRGFLDRQRRRRPEVPPRGVWPCRDRSPMEKEACRRRQRRWCSVTSDRRQDRLAGSCVGRSN